MTFIIIGIIVFIIAISKKQKKKPNNKTDLTNAKFQNANIEPKIITVIESKSNSLSLNKSSNLQSESETTIKMDEDQVSDDSIIDVSDLTNILLSDFTVTTNNSLVTSVPYWPHQYVCSYNEIKSANKEQQAFYHKYRTEFLNGKIIPINGNTNYAFILLFDLLNEFEIHKDYSIIENQLELLGNNFPSTKSYCVSFLVKKLEAYNMDDEAEKFREKNYQYDYDYWKLGKKYKKKLNLSEQQEVILNSIWFQIDNVFNEAEFCKIQILKQFLRAIEYLQEGYETIENAFNNPIDELTDLIVRKSFRYRKGSQNYKFTFDSVKNETYVHLLKLVENNIRDIYAHKRKLTTEFHYANTELQSAYQEKILSKVELFFDQDNVNVISPDADTEIVLNANNTTRWKAKYESIKQNYQNGKDFESLVLHLVKENIKNPSVENILFEASKFIAKSDKISSLRLYVHYIDVDLKSAKFDNKQINKTLQNSLFKNEEQLGDFEKILNQLIASRDLTTALESVNHLYEPKRKKIIINKNSIKEVENQYSGTIELLNEYLEDEEDKETEMTASNNETDEIQINITTDKVVAGISKYKKSLNLSDLQNEILNMFEKNSFSIAQDELEEVLKSKSQMMSSVIDSINEVCYELLDDVLIEEEENFYTIYPENYSKLQNND